MNRILKVLLQALLVTLVISSSAFIGFIIGVNEQKIQPLVAEKMEDFAVDFMEETLTRINEELNESDRCKALTEIKENIEREINWSNVEPVEMPVYDGSGFQGGY